MASTNSTTDNGSNTTGTTGSSKTTDTKLFPRDCITCDGPGCGKPAPVKRCSRCCSFYYCSVVCQKRHWTDREDPHKEHCTPVAVIRKKEENLIHQMLSCPVQPINTECSICFHSPLDPESTTVLPDCKHGFCTSCIITWQREAKKGNRSGCENPLACPYCRTVTTEAGKGDVKENLRDDLMTLASHDNFSRSPEVNQRLLDLLEIVLENHSRADVDVFMFKAQLLTELGRGEEARQVLTDLVDDCRLQRGAARMFDLMQQAEQARELGDRAVLDDLMHQVQFGYDEAEGLRRALSTEKLADIDMLKCEAYAAEEQWSEAMQLYSHIPATLNVDPPAIFIHRLCTGMARCAYHLKEYDRAIELSDTIILTGRQLPNVHKHKALSQKAMGDLDAAIRTMNQAVLYETPWDDHHMKEVQSLYFELVSERDGAKQEYKKA